MYQPQVLLCIYRKEQGSILICERVRIDEDEHLEFVREWYLSSPDSPLEEPIEFPDMFETVSMYTQEKTAELKAEFRVAADSQLLDAIKAHFPTIDDALAFLESPAYDDDPDFIRAVSLCVALCSAEAPDHVALYQNVRSLVGIARTQLQEDGRRLPARLVNVEIDAHEEHLAELASLVQKMLGAAVTPYQAQYRARAEQYVAMAQEEYRAVWQPLDG